MKQNLPKSLIANVTSVFVSAFLLISFSGYGQTYKQSADSYVQVAGTSTLHAWTMTSATPQIQATFEMGADGTLSQLKTLSVTVVAQSLKSQHNGMDKNAYSSLKTDKHKNISFALTTAKIQKDVIQFTGNLTIAGATKPMTLDATYKTNATGAIRCTGSKAFKMSEFQVEPPSFMFGTVKTGDEITVSFNVELSPAKN